MIGVSGTKDNRSRGTMPLMARDNKAREVILRRRAARRGLRVERSRRRDTAALGYGLYRIVDTLTGEVYAGDGPGGYALTLREVEQILDRGRR
jgi:hypothetical protein